LCFVILVAIARIEKGPDNVAARVGSNIQLKCMFHHRSCKDTMWTKNKPSGAPDILYVGNNLLMSFDGRYSVNVSPRRECTLHINRLQLSDAATFTCIEAVAGGSQQIRKAAIVTVIGMCLIISFGQYYLWIANV